MISLNFNLIYLDLIVIGAILALFFGIQNLLEEKNE